MSHRVGTTLDDETWGALDLMREMRGRDNMADMVRAILADAVDEFRSEIGAARQVGLNHCWAWPDAYSGDYDPRCCRFPKSCSPHGYIEAVHAGNLTDEHLEPRGGTP